jgi:two-component system, response regulator YesN
MRTIMIVDDERNIRLGIKAIIEREYPGRYDIALASGGEEALEAIQARRIDIVITDIRMPGMDGMALIRHAYDAHHRPSILILSGYDDFQYAREAIKYEVKEYLLKPIVREELHGAIARIEDELTRAEETAGLLSQAGRYRSDLAASVMNHLFLHAQQDEADAAGKLERAGLRALEPDYAVGVLKFAGDARQYVKAEEFLARRYEQESRTFWTVDKDGQLTVASSDPDCFAELMADLAGKTGSLYFIGLSRRASSAMELHVLYKQAKQALKRSLLQPHAGSAILVSAAGEGGSVPAVPVEDIRRLGNLLGAGKEQEIKSLLLRLFDLSDIGAGEDGVAYIEEVGRLLNELVFDRVFHTYGEESVEVLKLYKRVGSIDHYATVQDYYHDVENLLMLLSDYICNIKSVHGEHKEMRKALQYMHEHYAKDLNMTVVSNYVSLNYSYFGQIFKEYTGESFVNVLKKIRIEKAKELLAATDAKVYEIGGMVGFDNAKHFNRVFKELEGVTAMEYRTQQAAMQGQARMAEGSK